HAEVTRGADRGEHVGAAPGRAQRDEHVTRPPVRAHRARDRLLDAVVVRDRGERGRLGVDRDRAQRLALAAVAADELTRQVLRLRGAPAVADREQTTAGDEHAGERAAPTVEAVEVADERVQRAHERGEVTVTDAFVQRALRRDGRRHQPTPTAASPACSTIAWW